MPDPAGFVSGLVPGGQHLSAPFAAFLLLHVPAGLICVVTGAVAAASPKRRGRHPRFGTIYFWVLAVVFMSATGMAALWWAEDRHLFALGAISFGLALVGYLARRVRWKGWTSFHILGMGLSYVVLLTAFYVDNGPHLPLWDRLPAIAYWTLPAVVAAPLLVRALSRYTDLLGDLNAGNLALVRRGGSRRAPSEPASAMRLG
jgi:hypothetical protein